MPSDDRQNTRKKPSKLKTIGSWDIGRTIGKGSSGHVRIARHVNTGQFAAIKIVSKRALVSSRMSMTNIPEEEDKILQAIEREIVIMKLIDHPNVLSLYDVWETKNELYLVLEYVEGGELFDHLVRSGRLPVAEALHYFQQIIAAVDYCHRFNIAHRDLKPENLLIDKDKNIKVADFGMAAWEAGSAMLKTSCGSPHYASPEVVAGETYHGSLSDIWSCGVILYALLVGRLPFDDDNVRVLLDKVKEAKYTIPNDVESDAKDLIRRMLEKDVNRRITMAEIMKHPFVLSRPPRPMKQPILLPPTLEEVERPIESVDDIDADIFRNLKTLWHGASDDEIVDGLTNNKKTWEKAIYHLLLKYRARSLENYNMDNEDEPDETSPKLSRDKTTKRDSATSPALTSGPEIGVEHPSSERRSEMLPPNRPATIVPPRRTTSSRNLPTTSKNERAVHQARPQAPILSRSKEVTIVNGNRDTESLSSVNGAQIQSASTGTRSPNVSTALPDSAFQCATPARPNAEATLAHVQPGSPSPHTLDAESRASAASHSTGSGSSVQSPVMLTPLTPLAVPQVENESVQLFFRQIAEQLNMMQMRQSMISPNSSVGTSRPGPPESPDLHALAMAALNYAANPNALGYFSPGSAFSNVSPTAPPPPTPADGAFDFGQIHTGRRQPRVRDAYHNHGSPAQISYHQRRPVISPATAMDPMAYGLGISNYDVQSSRPAPRPPLRQARTAPASSRRGIVSTGPAASGRYSARPRAFSYGSDGSDKENPHGRDHHVGAYSGRPRSNSHHQPGQIEPLKPRSSIRSEGAPRRMTLGEKHVQIVLPQEDPEWIATKLRRRMSIYEPSESGSPYLSEIGSNVSSPDPSYLPVAPLSTPKRSWFTNMFNFKPASYSLLSVYDSRVTRDECKHLLRSQGVAVLVQNSDASGGGILKCRLDEVRDPAGVLSVVKAVRFRVEFHQTTSSHAAAGYATSVTLIQEKGALSSFKLLFNRLRREWELDTAGVGGNYANNSGNRQSYSSEPGQPQTLRLVPAPGAGSSFAASMYGTPSVRTSAFPSPALSAGGRFVDPVYFS